MCGVVGGCVKLIISKYYTRPATTPQTHQQDTQPYKQHPVTISVPLSRWAFTFVCPCQRGRGQGLSEIWSRTPPPKAIIACPNLPFPINDLSLLHTSACARFPKAINARNSTNSFTTAAFEAPHCSTQRCGPALEYSEQGKNSHPHQPAPYRTTLQAFFYVGGRGDKQGGAGER